MFIRNGKRFYIELAKDFFVDLHTDSRRWQSKKGDPAENADSRKRSVLKDFDETFEKITTSFSLFAYSS